jgi:hypothetical protein
MKIYTERIQCIWGLRDSIINKFLIQRLLRQSVGAYVPWKPTVLTCFKYCVAVSKALRFKNGISYFIHLKLFHWKEKELHKHLVIQPSEWLVYLKHTFMSSKLILLSHFSHTKERCSFHKIVTRVLKGFCLRSMTNVANGLTWGMYNVLMQAS